MNIYTYLKKDHQLIGDLMQAVLDTPIPSRRAELFATIKYELALHADAEEAIFYKAIEEATRSEAVRERMNLSNEEHDEIREYITALSELPVTSEEWIEQFGEFKHAVSHHVDEEESTVFETARLFLTAGQSIKLTNEMESYKQEHRAELTAA